MLDRLCGLYPGADIFTHVYDPTINFGRIQKHSIKTSFINGLPRARKLYQNYLPLMPLAIEQLDLTGYDLVISSEAGPAKGGIRHPDATHVCYVHSPMRYIWDQYATYRRKFGMVAKVISPAVFHYLRGWDFASAQRVDAIAANSAFVRRRIQHVWRRESEVIYPPVSVDEFLPGSGPVQDYYLWVGQMVPYKRPELAVEACTRLNLPLLMVGQGSMKAELLKLAGPTVKFVDKLSFGDLKKHFAECRALLYTGEEDFGITPVEVMASGRPVITLGRGGASETVSDEETGVHFQDATVDGLIEAIQLFDAWLPDFNPQIAVGHARRFTPENFDAAFQKFVTNNLT